jgi:hypothetical protein
VFEILDHPDLSSTKITASTAVAPKLTNLVMLPPDSCTFVATRDVVVEEALNLLRQGSEIYRYHVGYPEYSYLTIRKLRAFGEYHSYFSASMLLFIH